MTPAPTTLMSIVAGYGWTRTLGGRQHFRAAGLLDFYREHRTSSLAAGRSGNGSVIAPLVRLRHNCSPMVIVMMGPAGAGKTTIGRALAEQLGWPFVEGDDYHPARNIEKMRRGTPLTDQDRVVWLAAIHAIMVRLIDRREHAVVACSALKERYRQTLRGDLKPIRFVYLKADPAVLQQRLATRVGHFAGPALLQSQLEALEEPGDDLIVDATRPPADILQCIRREFGV